MSHLASVEILKDASNTVSSILANMVTFRKAEKLEHSAPDTQFTEMTTRAEILCEITQYIQDSGNVVTDKDITPTMIGAIAENKAIEYKLTESELCSICNTINAYSSNIFSPMKGSFHTISQAMTDFILKRAGSQIHQLLHNTNKTIDRLAEEIVEFIYMNWKPDSDFHDANRINTYSIIQFYGRIYDGFSGKELMMICYGIEGYVNSISQTLNKEGE